MMYDVDGGSKTCCCLDDNSDEGEEDIDHSIDIAANWCKQPCCYCNNAHNIWARPPGRKRLQGHQENFFAATKDIQLFHFPRHPVSPTKEVSTRPGPAV